MKLKKIHGKEIHPGISAEIIKLETNSSSGLLVGNYL